ncbi:MAG: hypothetical protein WCS70_04815 [Verrucomicrobiota bacterium]
MKKIGIFLVAVVWSAVWVGCASSSGGNNSGGISRARAVQIAQVALLHALGDDFTFQDNIAVTTWAKDATKWQAVWGGAPQANQRGNPFTGWVIIDKATGHVDDVQTALSR